MAAELFLSITGKSEEQEAALPLVYEGQQLWTADVELKLELTVFHGQSWNC